MPQPQNSASDLTTLTLEAVRALLRQIATNTMSPPSPAAPGTIASFSAQALRDLMQCEPLAQIVQTTVSDELTAAAGR